MARQFVVGDYRGQIKLDLACTYMFLVLVVSSKSCNLEMLAKSTGAERTGWLLILICMLICRRILHKLHERWERTRERGQRARIAPLGRVDATPLRPLGRIDDDERADSRGRGAGNPELAA